MPKQQTRRSVSITGVSYARLIMLADKRGQSGSAIIESLLNRECDAQGIPGVAREDLPKREPKPRSEVHGGGVRSF